MTAPWDVDVPHLDSSVVGQPELYAYLEQLRRGISSVMGGATEAHADLHRQIDAVGARVDALARALSESTAGTDRALAALGQTLSAATARKVTLVSGRASLPTLAIGGSRAVTVTWSTPAAAAPTGVDVFIEAGGIALGSVTAAIVADSVTAKQLTVQVTTAGLALSPSAGSLHAIGVVWAP